MLEVFEFDEEAKVYSLKLLPSIEISIRLLGEDHKSIADLRGIEFCIAKSELLISLKENRVDI